MKKNLLVALMFGTLIGYAKENTKPTNLVGGKKVKVEFEAVKKGQTLAIKDENGITIYKRGIQSSGNFAKIFDLSALNDGIYTTELEKDFEIIVKTIKVDKGIVSFLSEKKNIIFKPVIRTEGDLVMISKIAFNKKPLKVVLYYNDTIILSETVSSKEELVNRIYKLSETEKGAYKVVVNSDNRLYVKDFTI